MWGLLLYVFVIACAMTIAYLLGLFTGALYVPTYPSMVEDMLDAAAPSSSDRLVDLGSGDGRIVIAAAKRGIPSVGYEINPLLVWTARRSAKKAGVEPLARFYWKNFWNADLSGYSIVAVYGIGHIMGALEKKLERELPPGSRVVSNLFAFPNWEGQKKHGVFVYQR